MMKKQFIESIESSGIEFDRAHVHWFRTGVRMDLLGDLLLAVVSPKQRATHTLHVVAQHQVYNYCLK